LAIALENPALGQLRVSNTLKQDGIFVSPGGVRSIWLRHGLETFKKRLKALEEKAAAENLVLTESQLQAMEKAKEQREAQGEIETEHPGYLGAQDTYYVGTIKGIGRIYQQTFIDTYAKIGFAKLYTSKHAITAADLLNDRVLPWYEEQSVRLLRILTDRGTEYNGSIENHEYQLYLAIEDIDHSKTKARHPQTNGICERFHRTIKEEFYDIAFRKKVYKSLDELQADLDQWMAYYNAERPHSGKYCDGRTPDQTFSDTKHLADEKMIDTHFPKEVARQDPNSFAVAA
jgi:transposase InsO family protein